MNTVPHRFVVVFDTTNAEVLNDLAPMLLQADGFSTKRYFHRLGIAIVAGADLDFEALTAHCDERRVPLAVLPETTYYAISEPGSDSFQDAAELTWGLQPCGRMLRRPPEQACGWRYWTQGLPPGIPTSLIGSSSRNHSLMARARRTHMGMARTALAQPAGHVSAGKGADTTWLRG